MQNVLMCLKIFSFYTQKLINKISGEFCIKISYILTNLNFDDSFSKQCVDC